MNTDQIVQEAMVDARDHRTRRIIVALSLVALLSMFTALFAIHRMWQTAEAQAAAGQTLAAQVKTACAEGTLDDPEMVIICKQAAKIEKLAGYPVSWTFSVGENTWICDDQDLDHNYICRLQN